MGDWRSEIEDLLGRGMSGLTPRDIENFASRLGRGRAGEGQSGAEETGPGLIDRIAVLERLKAAAAAEQVRAEAAFAELCAAGADPRAVALEGKTGRSAATVRERSAASQVALARGVSPSKGSRLLAAARRLVEELPYTLTALAAGRLNEDRAVAVAEGVEALSPAERSLADEDLCGDPRRLEGLGDRGVQDAVRACVDAIDGGAALARVRHAESQRRVTLRRLPDSMAQLTAILPVAQAAAVEGALRQASGAARAVGDDRTSGQIAADTLVERVTGQAQADAVPLRVGLVMTDASLFGGGRESAILQGYGTITAAQARNMIAASARGLPGQSGARAAPDAVAAGGLDTAADACSAARAGAAEVDTRAAPGVAAEMGTRVAAEIGTRAAAGGGRRPAAADADRSAAADADTRAAADADRRHAAGARTSAAPANADRRAAAEVGTGAAALAGVWLRRLFLDPSTGELAALDSKLRRFPRALADFIEIRDQRCRTPFCDAPIRHIDHVVPAVEGGDTSVENGQGLCEACNHTKESPGWDQAVVGADPCDGTGPRGDILTVTPTGHEYFSPPVHLPGSLPLMNPRPLRVG
ncbi:DUF222 domain-containing protein [Sinomonas sp. G460-2]|uniref:HNH endonuclease n=1 Tax=Sinomonas sp. G460-2 TaxID=3393464 RepID=UPI0039F0353E